MAVKMFFELSNQRHVGAAKLILLGLLIYSAKAKFPGNDHELFDSKKINISNWLRDYELVTVYVCPTSLKTRATVSFTAKNNEYSIEFSKEHHIADNADVYVNNAKLDAMFMPHNAESINVYTGLVTRPCCGYEAVMKVTTGDLDIFIKMSNDTLFLEPASRFILNHYLPRTHGSESCEQFLCVFYQGRDIIPKPMASTAAYFELNDEVKREELEEVKQKRRKRNLPRTECSLYIAADHTFYQGIGNSNIKNTISEMLYLVSEANLIFRGTDFAGDGKGDNIGFQVVNVTIFTSDVGYKMADKAGVKDYLTSFSEINFDRYCLATAFSSRDFDNGVIGLAWVASPNKFGPPGGICQKRVNYLGTLMSYNTALITTHNHGERLPMYHSALTLSHEYGHNFGSPHDATTDEHCAPGSEYGNYIMFPSAADESKPNTDIFSPCSISYMFPVIRNKGSCFEETKEPVCGNGIIEGDEECDCGMSDTCMAVDPCCTPSDVKGTNQDLPCTLRRTAGKECSFKTSPCCTAACKIVAAVDKQICRHERDCILPALCDGTSAHCHGETPEPDGSLCNDGKKTCSNGRCVGSICFVENMSPCTCTGSDQCYECCKSNTTTCSSIWGKTKSRRMKAAGALCENNEGVCDGKGNCLSGGYRSTRDRMVKAFTESGYNSVRVWFSAYWYYFVAGIVTLIILVAIFVTTCRGESRVTSEAFVHGQFLRVSLEAEIHKNYLERRRKETRDLYRRKLSNLDVGSKQMNFSEALARMMTFFPTVPVELLIKTLKTSGDEDTAVKWLLLRQHPFRRVSHPVEMQN